MESTDNVDIEKLSKKSHIEELSKITQSLSNTQQNLELAGSLWKVMIFCNLFVKNKEIYSILINFNIFKDTLHKECRSIRGSESTEKRYNTHK